MESTTRKGLGPLTFAVLAAAFATALARKGTAQSPAPAGRLDQAVGRYQVAGAGTSFLVIDTTTGNVVRVLDGYGMGTFPGVIDRPSRQP